VADKSWTDQARGALGRYRVMAYVTGTMLLLLVVELIVKYPLQASDSVVAWIGWIPYAHGWIYVVYLVTVLDLWSKVRWGFGRLVTMVLAGVVPVMSFVLERRVHADALAQIETGGPAGGRTLRAADAAH
jgi:integral membrane protein